MTQPKTPALADDSGIGLAMLIIFIAAVLFVTGAVAVLALVGSWWMLGVAVAAHVVMTAIVSATIAYSMSGQTPAVGRANGDQGRDNPRLDTTSPHKAVAVHL